MRKLVEDMAQSYEKPQEVINWYFRNRKRLAELEGTALEDNVSRLGPRAGARSSTSRWRSTN